MLRTIGVAAFFYATALGAQAQEYDVVFAALDEAVRSNYYDPHFGGRDWAEIRARHQASAESARSDAEFLRAGQEMLNELGVSHVSLHPPVASPRPSMGIGARIAVIDGASTVIDIDPASGARGAGLRVGDRILNPDAVFGPPSEPARLEVERCDGTRAIVPAPRESAYWPPRQKTISWSALRRGDGRSVGYLKADRFEDDGAELIDAAMAALASTDGLIIDLRDNSGGNASALRLLSYFGRPGPGMALLSRQFLATLDGPVQAEDLAEVHRAERPYTTDAVFQAVSQGQGATLLMIEEIGEARYRNPVVVLIGPDTGSAAEGFAWGVRRASEAKLIGRPTAGALLSSDRFDLPGGWSVTLPVHGIWAPDGEDYGDRSVPPHIETVLTRSAVCAGEDPDLATAVSTLEAAWSSSTTAADGA
ncbi:MAG: S41 family peptidase [Brevundimonas sp.]